MSINGFSKGFTPTKPTGSGLTSADLLVGLGTGNSLDGLGLPTAALSRTTPVATPPFGSNPLDIAGGSTTLGLSNMVATQPPFLSTLPSSASVAAAPQQASPDIAQVLGLLVTLLTSLMQTLKSTDTGEQRKKDEGSVEGGPAKSKEPPPKAKSDNNDKTEAPKKEEPKKEEPKPEKAENSPPVNGADGVGDAEQREFLDLVNKARAENGLKPVKLNNELNKAAKDYSTTLKNANAFEHGLNGTTPGSRAQEAGYPSSFVGENIAKGSQDVKGTFEMWMNSPGHRANILNPDYTEIGLGRDGDLWTQTLGRP